MDDSENGNGGEQVVRTIPRLGIVARCGGEWRNITRCCYEVQSRPRQIRILNRENSVILPM